MSLNEIQHKKYKFSIFKVISFFSHCTQHPLLLPHTQDAQSKQAKKKRNNNNNLNC